MTLTNERPTFPQRVSLRAFIEEGGEVWRELDRIENLLDTVRDLEFMTDDERERSRATEEGFAEAFRRNPFIMGGAAPVDADMVRCTEWQADLYADPSLAALVVEQLPAGRRAEHDLDLARRRRPRPITVQTPLDRWTCGNCGRVHAGRDAVAVHVGATWPESDAEEARFCGECIVEAARAVASAERFLPRLANVAGRDTAAGSTLAASPSE